MQTLAPPTPETERTTAAERCACYSVPELVHLDENRRVVMTDGNQYFNRPGPRVVESTETLAEILNPEGCDFGHRGCGWNYWTGDARD